MFHKFMQWLVPKLEDWCLARGKFMTITGTQGPDDVYLLRCFLFRSKRLSIYIHRFLRSDRDDHHDHPFNFLGYVVTKGYEEERVKYTYWENNGWHEQRRKWTETRAPGTWGYRKATDIHMVRTDKERPYSEFKEAPLTIIFRGPYIRDWGFWKQRVGEYEGDPEQDVYGKWVKWTEYLGVPESDIRE